MAVFAAALLGGLVSVAGSLVGRVLLSLGLGYVSYTGIDTALSAIKAQLQSSAAALPSYVVGMMGWMQIGTGFSILLSAITMRFVLQGLTSGALKRFVVK